LGIEVAHRVVGDRREVHHTVEAFEVAWRELAHIAHDLAVRRCQTLPGAAFEQVEVTTGDVVTGLLQQPDEMRADIAPVTGDEDLHCDLAFAAASRLPPWRGAPMGSPCSMRGCRGPGRLARFPQFRQI